MLLNLEKKEFLFNDEDLAISFGLKCDEYENNFE
jgi:hypothetical protein